MKKQFSIKSFIAGMLLATLLFSFIGFADDIAKNIEVYANKINIKVNGKLVQTDNFLYNGTTYAPMRTIAEILGKEVQWDPATYTANIVDPVIKTTNLEANSRTNPAKIGEKFVVEVKDWLIGKYKYEITLTELKSGDAAWKDVFAGNKFNKEPEEGKEYILAKFKIKLLEIEGNKTFELYPIMFDCVSSNGVLYSDFISVSGLNSDIRTELYKGAEHEGWTYFLVDKSDNPVAVINRTNESEVWFNLRSK